MKTYGVRGGKALMRLEMAMDGGQWRSSGWPLTHPSFEDGSIQAMAKNTQPEGLHCLCVHRYVGLAAMFTAQGRAWTAQASHASTLRYQKAEPRLLTRYFHPYFPHPPKYEGWNISLFLELFVVLWNFWLIIIFFNFSLPVETFQCLH